MCILKSKSFLLSATPTSTPFHNLLWYCFNLTTGNHSLICFTPSLIFLSYTVWSPHYKKDKELLEKIQHRFTRLFKELRQLTYAERLDVLGLWSLEERRNRADLVEVYKMINGQSAIPAIKFF